MLNDLRQLDGKQRSAVTASYLGWTLDAFDFFILVFVFKDVAKTFGTDVTTVSWSAVPDAGRAADRRIDLRSRRRQVRPPADADGRYTALFGAGIRVGLRAQPRRVSWFCACSSASPWAANGASVHR